MKGKKNEKTTLLLRIKFLSCHGARRWKKFIFKDNICKDKYLYYLRHNTFKNDIEIIAYCVMDNRVHALFFCNELKRISKYMQETNTSFAIGLG